MSTVALRMDSPGRVDPKASPAWRRLIDRLYALSTMGMSLGLERVDRVLAALDRPEHRFPSVHIAGSNGKGSTAAFLATILAESGRRVGLYTSPHLVSLTERVQILQRGVAPAALSEEALLEAFEAVESVAPSFGDLSFFEAITAAGMWAFAQRGIEVAVVEAGLGARLDATRLVRAEVSVLTELALEHTAILGDTLEAIAREKLAVIRPDRPLVAADSAPSVSAVITAAADAANAPLSLINRDLFVRSLGAGRFDLDLGDLQVDQVRLPLLGPHQGRNALLAASAAVRFDPGIGADTIRRGLAKTRWPGRMEIVRATAPRIVLDGAHNAQGTAALIAGIEAHPAEIPHPIHLVFGVLGDKDAGAMIGPLARLARTIILTRADSPRARSAEDLLPLLPAEARVRASCAASVPEALARAEARAVSEGGTIVVAGSLYLVGEARALLAPGSLL